MTAATSDVNGQRAADRGSILLNRGCCNGGTWPV